MNLFSRILPSVALAATLVSGIAAAQDDEGDTIVVRGTLIPDEKKSTSEISSFLDAEDFERAGDSDIAAALRRVTGLSVKDGRFLIVRGLNERYSSATLNGLSLPSPEPLRRAAPLDLFPTSVIESTLVQKTFSPQYSGEFGGGLVELRSKAIPDEDFLEVGVSFSANSETTLQDALFYEGSNGDVFGFDDGLRNIPDAASLLFSGENLTSDEQNLVDTSFEQSKTILLNRDEAPANGSGSIALGKRFYSEGDMSIGTVFYLGYDNDWQSRKGQRGRIEGNNSFDTDFELTRQEVAVSALSSTGVEFNYDHSVQLTGLLARKSLKEAGIDLQNQFGDERVFLIERTDFIERQLWQGQLTGEHLFPSLSDLEFTWKVGYGEAKRDQPYKRETGFRLDESTGDFLFTVEEGLSSIDFRFLKDENLNAGFDFKLPTDMFGAPIEFKFGGAYTDNSRTTAQRLFEFRGAFPVEIVNSRADLVFSDEVLVLDASRIELRATRGEPDNFDGSLEVNAAYVGADIELGPYVRAAIGGRYEESTQEVSTFVTTDPTGTLQQFDPIEEEYFLPAATITWNPVGNFQLRGAYSQTITRPQFRELSPSIFTDPNTDQDFIGNPFLSNTEIENFDLRAEVFFRRGEFATLGLFYKELENPIEEARIAQGETVRTTFINAPAAELFGFEAEFEKNFYMDELFPDGEFWYGKELVFKTNYTYSDGTVSSDGEIIVPRISGQGVFTDVRAGDANIIEGSRLVGLSEHLFNLQLGVQTENDATITLAANYASDRTLIRGEPESTNSDGVLQFTPSVVEEVPVTLDFVLQQPITLFAGEFDFTFKVQNLLNGDYSASNEATEFTQETEDTVYQQYGIGRTISIGLKRSF